MSYPIPPSNGTGGWARLQELKPQINDAHEAVEDAGRSAVEHAISAGEMLLEAQKEVKEAAGWGHWGNWLQDNFSGSESTAGNYMRLASHKDMLAEATEAQDCQRVGKISLRHALTLISKPKRSEYDSDSEEDSEEEAASAEAAKKRSAKNGSRKGPGKPGRCDPPAAEIYGVGDLPVPESKVKAALGDGRTVVLRSDAPSGAEKALEAAKSCLEDVVRGAWAAGYDARLALLFSSSVSGLERGFPAVESVVALEGDEEPPSEAALAKHEKRAIRETDKGELTLYQAVMARGGIKPRPDAEEYDKVPLCYLRKDGLAADEIGDELGEYCPHLGVKDEDTLLAAVAARRKRG